jgi:hypothetical protein
MDAEGGAPWMFGYSPTFHYDDDDEDLSPYDVLDRNSDLCRILGLEGDPAGLSAEQQKQLDDLHESMGTALEIALESVQLPAGEYHYANYFQQFQYPDLSSFMPPLFDTWELHSAYKHMPVPQGDNITFQLTDAHVKLLPQIRVDWYEPEFYTGINFKRPYGDMTYFELDMAAILEIPVLRDAQNQPQFSDEQRRTFHTLHTDMLFVLPRQGKISAGHYQVVDDRWSLVS